MKLLPLTLLFLSCAPSEYGQREQPKDTQPTLLIINSGIENLKVTDEYGQVLGRAYTGERACIVLSRSSRLQQVFLVLPYKLIALPPFDPFSHPGWKVEIFNSPEHDVMRLVPGERCK